MPQTPLVKEVSELYNIPCYNYNKKAFEVFTVFVPP